MIWISTFVPPHRLGMRLTLVMQRSCLPSSALSVLVFDTVGSRAALPSYTQRQTFNQNPLMPLRSVCVVPTTQRIIRDRYCFQLPDWPSRPHASSESSYIIPQYFAHKHGKNAVPAGPQEEESNCRRYICRERASDCSIYQGGPPGNCARNHRGNIHSASLEHEIRSIPSSFLEAPRIASEKMG